MSLALVNMASQPAVVLALRQDTVGSVVGSTASLRWASINCSNARSHAPKPQCSKSHQSNLVHTTNHCWHRDSARSPPLPLPCSACCYMDARSWPRNASARPSAQVVEAGAHSTKDAFRRDGLGRGDEMRREVVRVAQLAQGHGAARGDADHSRRTVR